MLRAKPYICLLLLLILVCACSQISSGKVPKGSENKLLSIKTKPTKAAIYKDGQYIGNSPLQVWLWHGAPTVSKIVAVPLFEHQFIQFQSLKIPGIPTQLTLYMTEPSTHKYDFSDKPNENNTEQNPSPFLKRLQLFFGFDQDRLNASEIKRLASWLGQFDSNINRIEVHAYADETGSQNYNKALSYRRAFAVTECLQQLKIKTQQLMVIYHGERVSLTPERQLPRQSDRLVELLVFY